MRENVCLCCSITATSDEQNSNDLELHYLSWLAGCLPARISNNNNKQVKQYNTKCINALHCILLLLYCVYFILCPHHKQREGVSNLSLYCWWNWKLCVGKVKMIMLANTNVVWKGYHYSRRIDFHTSFNDFCCEYFIK